MAYTTDLTLAQFEVLDELLPKSKTRKGIVSKHLIVNGILYQLKNGCQWRDLPDNFQPSIPNFGDGDLMELGKRF
jgi:transposase